MNEQGLYEIYEYWHVPFWQTSLFYYSVISIGILILAVLLFFLLKKIKKKSQTPLQQAMQKLLGLKTKQIHNTQEAQEAYLELTACLKQFFQKHYAMPFEGMTDQEMMAALQQVGLHQNDLADLKQLVHAGSTVKYAQNNALQKDFLHHIQISTTIINQLCQPVLKEK